MATFVNDVFPLCRLLSPHIHSHFVPLEYTCSNRDVNICGLSQYSPRVSSGCITSSSNGVFCRFDIRPRHRYASPGREWAVQGDTFSYKSRRKSSQKWKLNICCQLLGNCQSGIASAGDFPSHRSNAMYSPPTARSIERGPFLPETFTTILSEDVVVARYLIIKLLATIARSSSQLGGFFCGKVAPEVSLFVLATVLQSIVKALHCITASDEVIIRDHRIPAVCYLIILPSMAAVVSFWYVPCVTEGRYC